MKAYRLASRSLAYYWRTNAAVVLGVGTAVAALAGALLVGDSVRGSLRDLVLQRLGRADSALLASGFFREALAEDLRADDALAGSFDDICPVIFMQGLVSEPAGGRRASHVQVYGVDDRFWRFHGVNRVRGPERREALLSRALASDIGAVSGSSVLIRVERPSAIPIESLHGRKDNLGRTLRLTVREIVGATEMGDFSLLPTHGDVRAAFVPLGRMQQDLDRRDRVNALLVSARSDALSSASGLRALVRRRFALEDVELTARVVPSGELAIEAAAGILDEPRARAVDEAASGAAMTSRPILTYLANAIRSGDRQVPYSLVTATDLRFITPGTPVVVGSSAAPIILNDWAARDLAVKAGDPLSLEYFVWEEPGRLLTKTAEFEVAGVVPIAGAAADRDLAPVYPGITEARNLASWDPPFPIDLGRVRRTDEDYWDRYRTTPKAFIPFEIGQRLWGSRFGDRTSVRVALAPGEPPDDARERWASRLRSTIDPLALGLSVHDVRAEGVAASRGATDFGEYFTYFSFFLVVSALMLAALFFRLGVEQRAREIGLLRSVGFSTARVGQLLSAEAFVLATIGGVIGVAGAVGYGAVMMAGLRTWWLGAVGTRLLWLHVSMRSLASGAGGALIAAMLCIWWTLRGLRRLSERSLLAGQLVADVHARRRRPGAAAVRDYARGHRVVPQPLIGAVVFGLVGTALAGASFLGAADRTSAFFGAGMSLLVACLCAVAVILRHPPRSSLDGPRWKSICRIGFRNAADRPGRSVLAVGVIASATFILIAVGAFRREAPASTDRHSGLGGYALLVELLLPIASDPNGPDGRETLGLDGVDGVAIEPFRVLPGDDASCLNLYQPRNPRVLGANRRFIDSGRFAFQSSLASTDAERANPWLLLTRDPGGDVVPVIADASSMTYVLRKRLGDELVMTRGDRSVRLRFVGALADSIFQGELLMAEERFVRLFPEQEGYRFLLVDAPPDRAARVAQTIEQDAADLGADAATTTERLAAFHAVENTYLSTFQTLGGLGLLLGTVGLAAVLLRNVLERRRELALLAAVGYGQRHIFGLVVAENLLLLAWGLAIGAACAVVAVAPALSEHGGRGPVISASDALLMVAVFGAGLLSSAVATRAALRTPLVSALRSE